MAQLTKRIRHFITGEWIEVPLVGDGGRVVATVIHEPGDTGRRRNTCKSICSKRPMVVQSLAVHATQVEAAAKAAPRGTEFVRTDNNFYAPALSSKAAYNRYLRSKGKHNRDSYD
jgi:hypothetical protein